MTLFLLRAMAALGMIAALISGAFVANDRAAMSYVLLAYLTPWSATLLFVLAALAFAWAAEVLALLGRILDRLEQPTRRRDPRT